MKRRLLQTTLVVSMVVVVTVWTALAPFMLVGGAGVGAYRGMKYWGWRCRRGYEQSFEGFREQWRKSKEL